MKRNKVPFSEAAFNRLELLLVLATLVLLAGVALPALASTKTRSQRLLCVANLRQIGHAYHLWGNDRGNKTPCRTPLIEGGVYGSPSGLKNNAWWQFQILSNELVTPRILACPADRNVGAPRVTASNWSANDPNRGYATIGLRDNATSYTVALDAFFDRPRLLLSSDRNFYVDGYDFGCSSGVGGAWFCQRRQVSGSGVPVDAHWTNSIHAMCGNVLAMDGTVQQTLTPGLRASLDADEDNGVLHFLIPN